ncbi:MAG: hypothetical protein K0B02_02865 [DPANN group archaeon]|nr:hypothetical protein [DPANN group archaeon]
MLDLQFKGYDATQHQLCFTYLSDFKKNKKDYTTKIDKYRLILKEDITHIFENIEQDISKKTINEYNDIITKIIDQDKLSTKELINVVTNFEDIMNSTLTYLKSNNLEFPIYETYIETYKQLNQKDIELKKISKTMERQNSKKISRDPKKSTKTENLQTNLKIMIEFNFEDNKRKKIISKLNKIEKSNEFLKECETLKNYIISEKEKTEQKLENTHKNIQYIKNIIQINNCIVEELRNSDATAIENEIHATIIEPNMTEIQKIIASKKNLISEKTKRLDNLITHIELDKKHLDALHNYQDPNTNLDYNTLLSIKNYNVYKIGDKSTAKAKNILSELSNENIEYLSSYLKLRKTIEQDNNCVTTTEKRLENDSIEHVPCETTRNIIEQINDAKQMIQKLEKTELPIDWVINHNNKY